MVLPIVLLGVVGTIYYQDVMKQSVSNDTLSSAETISILTPEYMNATQLYLKSIADRPLVIKAIGDNDTSFLHSMAEYTDITSRVNSAYFVDSRGIVVECSGNVSNTIGDNVSNRSYIASVLRTGKPVIGDAEPGFDGLPVVPIAVPIMDNSTMLGELVGTVDLNEYANTFKNAVTQGQYVYIVNRTGHVMVHNNAIYMRNMTDFNSVPAVQAVLSGKSGFGDYYNPFFNQSVIGGYAPINQTGWGVVVAIPQDVAYQPVWNTTWPIVAATIILSLIAIALGLLFGNSIVAPIEDLSKAMNMALKSDDYRKSLPLGRRDEIGDLARSFGDMVDTVKRETGAREQLLIQLNSRTNELETANEELQVRGEEMEAQSEELQCANEELRCNNDEMQGVSRSLREVRDYLESLINYANAPIIVWDPKFTITRFNHAFERLSGYTSNEVIGKDLRILFPPDSREESLEKIRKTLAGEQWESVEIPIQYKSDGISIVLWNSANVYGEDGSLIATIAQGQDITKRKQAEKALEEAKEQAELYLDLMGHDISNMHQIIMGQLELSEEIIKTVGKLESGDQELIDTPIKTLKRAAKLIDNVRKLQKLRAGEYSLEAIDLSVLLKDVLNDYSGITDRDITIKFEPDGTRLVWANALLRDVFSNLVDNAVKHSSGPLTLLVNISRVGHDGRSYYRVAFEDNGNGIPDDKKEEVFHRFKRGPTRAKGTGLGLYLVKTLVEGLGGYVEVQNRVLDDYTRGTRFLIYLPAVEGNIAGH